MSDAKKDTGYYCRVEADSLNPWGQRLTTIVCRYPRLIHAAVSKHRMLSISGASSRAIPTAKLIERVRRDPVEPMWTKNQKGMQGESIHDEMMRKRLHLEYLRHVEEVCVFVDWMSQGQVHKQNVNRLLEPFMWIDCVITATDWSNLFGLRIHKDAQDEFELLAKMIYVAMRRSKPSTLQKGDWHLPLTDHDRARVSSELFHDRPSVLNALRMVSAARCARTSYARHDGKDTHWEDDFKIAVDLKNSTPLHAVPFEHQATPCEGRHGNFNGWKQARKLFDNENITSFNPSEEEMSEWEQEVREYIEYPATSH
jgi:thymidylate synthase ThyX